MPEKDTSDAKGADNGEQGTQTVTPPKTARKKSPKPSRKPPKQLPPFNVVLLDDDDHTYEYVIEMLGKVFGYVKEKAFELAKEVDSSGRVIVLTTHKELAELKRDQILGYGRDRRISACRGSMTAIIEPAEG
jgi:ATP-dependent Clp protease adaptor protein ClpS